jgi:hypothetical protein
MVEGSLGCRSGSMPSQGWRHNRQVFHAPKDTCTDIANQDYNYSRGTPAALKALPMQSQLPQD